MRKLKKALCLVMAMSLVVASFSGCGTKSSQKANDSTGSESSDSSKGDKFYIGGIGPISGAAAVYGQNVQNGAELAVKEINAAGGINGKQVEFKFADDEHDPEKSVNAYNTLKDWGMQILMGTVTSAPCKAVAAETYSDNMFELTPSASSTDVIANGNVFQVCFTDPNQGVASADYIADKKIATKVAVIYDSSDVYSSGIYEKFAQEAKTKGLQVVAAEAFTADSKSDFSVQIQKAKDSGAELVFLPIYYTEATLILKQANDIGYKPTFFGCDGLDGILGVKNFDTSLAEGVMLLTPFNANATDDATAKFVKDFKAAYTDAPNQFAADAYDAMYILKAAIEKAKVTPDMSSSDMCDKLKTTMTELKYSGLTGADMSWAATGEVNKAPKAITIKNGAYVSQ